ncbi:diguanylate cyclase [Rhabdochromatium marinum]|uniref:diguanylate cyclase n=1 Tax=Rhabdochromatium marinum TaxID=48729 RepID=UPI001904B10E|nr:diguanylate cyclase [Rhabdochromatium marinum]MBK1647632.1 diguanylate cyclase [Rhabdochromatium marinum]
MKFLTLRAKLLLLLLPLVIGPLLGLGWLAYERLRTSTQTNLLREMDTLLDQMALNEATHRRSALANAKLFAGSNVLKRYLFASEDERVNFLLLPLLNLFASYQDAYDTYGDIRLVDPDGQVLARYRSDDQAKAPALQGLEAYLADLRSKDADAMARYVRNQAGDPLLLVGHKLVFVDPVLDDNRIAEPSLRGFLLLAISPDHLRQQVINSHVGQTGQILFTDAQAQRLFDDASTGADAPLEAEVRTAIQASTADGSVHQAEHGGQQTLVRAQSLTPNLAQVAFLPVSELDIASATLRQNIAVVALLALLLAAILLLVVLHLLVLKPVRRLERGAAAIGGGDLRARVPVRGRDELAHLASVFNQMAANLEASQQEKDQAQQEALASKQLAIDSLRKADRLKDDFLANTSHELRTPLHGIIGLAESLRAGAAGAISPAVDENLGLIIASSQRLATLVNDILDFSRLHHHELQLHLTAVDVRSICDLVLQLLAKLAESKGLALINSIPDQLPLALADENRLQQILYNLIGNGIKFTDQGSIQVRASVNEQRQLAISVCDTGPGIPPEQHETVFASFEQLDSGAGRMYGGTGLGLAVTRSLVRAMGGQIVLESEVGAGACFHFTLPVADQAPVNAPVGAAEALASEATALSHEDQPAAGSEDQETVPSALDAWTGGGQLVLIVDDDPVNLRVLTNQLVLQGFRVQTTTDGEQALAWMSQSEADDTRVVLLDVMMPRINGFEVCRQLRKRFAANDLPIVFLTARTQERDILEGFSVGGNDYLPKPFSRGELIARVHTHVDLVERTRALHRLTEELEQRVRERTRELEAAHAEMKRLAMRDGLTQVFNRRYLDQALAREWGRAGRHGEPLAAMMIDVDFFKQYNDRYGHSEGDRCLRAVAQVLSEQVRRGGDIVARYGGEEFCVIVQSQVKEAHALAEHLCAAVAALAIEHRDSSVADHVTISIGVATLVPDSSQQPDDLLKRADAALYQAKQQGRNRVISHHD